MKKVILNNGYKMPLFGLGTFKTQEGKTAYDTIKYALELGYRHIDTAQMYGNEDSIGDAIKDSKVDRKDIFITTKQFKHSSFEKMQELFDESLRKLNTDYVDLYLIHWPNHDPKINANTWAFFESLYESGKAKAIGISNFQIHHIENLMKAAKIKPMVNQVEMHPGLSQVPLKKYLDEKNIQLESYGPLMKGRVFEGKFEEELSKIAKKYNKTIAQIVIAWGLKRNIVMIPKSITPSRIKDNYEAQFIDLSDDDVKVINQLNQGVRLYSDPDNAPWGNLYE
jgi:methylglyoxal/glyoxal reductase